MALLVAPAAASPIAAACPVALVLFLLRRDLRDAAGHAPVDLNCLERPSPRRPLNCFSGPRSRKSAR
jgi:hypothetical protein